MGKLNPDLLVQPVSPGAPSGDDLVYDASFLRLEEMFKGTPEKQVGGTIIAAEEPNWREVSDLAIELCARTKHLRVILIASVSLLQIEGLLGLRDGLRLLESVVENQWETLFPRLDPDDNNDPLERVNIIASLSAPLATYGDPFRFIERIRAAPLASSRQHGRFGLLDILKARGEIPAGADAPTPEMSRIDGAFADTPPAELQALLDAANQSSQIVQRIDKLLDERVGLGRAPDLKGFIATLREVAKTLENALGRRVGGSPGSPDVPAAAGPSDAPSAVRMTGDITSPRDVILALDNICRYYERSELSSPVPFILRAAKRMVSKNFVDIARIMTPEAIRTVEEMGREEGSAG